MPQWNFVPVKTSFWCATCGANWVVLCCDLKLATECISSVSPLEGLQCRSMSDAACVVPVRNYKGICGWKLPVLGLNACGRGHTANCRELLPVSSLRQDSKCPRHPKTCCNQPVAHMSVEVNFYSYSYNYGSYKSLKIKMD